MRQLATFDGMLQASNNRHSAVFNTLFTSTIIQTTSPDGSQTAEIIATDLIEIASTSSKSDDRPVRLVDKPSVILRPSQSLKLPSRPTCNMSNPQARCDKKSSQPNTVNANRSRAYTAPSTEMPSVPLPISGQSISNLALDRSSKYNSGRVKRHRDKFEGKTERKSAPTQTSIVVSMQRDD